MGRRRDLQESGSRHGRQEEEGIRQCRHATMFQAGDPDANVLTKGSLTFGLPQTVHG